MGLRALSVRPIKSSLLIGTAAVEAEVNLLVVKIEHNLQVKSGQRWVLEQFLFNKSLTDQGGVGDFFLAD